VKPVLLDTGCIVALLDRSERHHRRAVEVVQDIEAPLVTCEPVLAEACYLLRRVVGASQAVIANVAAGTFRVPFRLESSAEEVRGHQARYADVPMDLADACLVQMANELVTGRHPHARLRLPDLPLASQPPLQ
jgi:predicted nucleic acid-binding protein